MSRYIILTILLLFVASYTFSAFEEDNISVRGTAMGGALTSLCDDVSTIFYNPASTGFIVPDSSIKANFQYANKFSIPDYNLYSGNLMFPKFKLKTGISFISEGMIDTISENRLKISFGKARIHIPPFTYIDKTIETGLGISLNYYSLSASGYQFDSGDNTISSKTGLGFDFGLLLIKENLSFGFVLKNVMIASITENMSSMRFGISYKFPEHSSIISLDFEPIKGINNYNREWLKLGNLKIGERVYPLFHIGIEKTVKKILILRLGLKDFKLNAGIGVKIKGIITEYSFTTEDTGITHRLGLTI